MISFFEKHNKLSWLTAIIGAVLIFYISSRTFQPTEGGFSLTPIVYHFYAFFLLSAFILISILKGKIKKKKIIIGIAIAIFYGISDEIHQLFVPGRSFSLFDIMINSTGIIFAAILYIQRFKFKK